MDRKVLDIRVTECRARRPTSGHSNRGNKSFNRRDNLRTNSLFTAGDLKTEIQMTTILLWIRKVNSKFSLGQNAEAVKDDGDVNDGENLDFYF